MTRRVLECLTYDTATATCTQQAWVEIPEPIPDLTAAQVEKLGGLALSALAVAWAWKQLTRSIRD